MDETKEILQKLELKFQEWENRVYEEIAYLRKHNHNIEAEALRYKADGICKCKLEVFDVMDKL